MERGFQVGVVLARPDSRMNRAPSPVIHEVLPSEVLSMIFEEHANCEWSAPAIDGRVCRFWRRVVLNTPRAWRYLQIYQYEPKYIWGMQSWLNRSGTVPLHLHIAIDMQIVFDLLRDCHTRIASLQMYTAYSSFFEGRKFPCLRLLDVTNWYLHGFSRTLHFCSLPELRSLRLGYIDHTFAAATLRPVNSVVALNDLTSLESLVLCRTTCTSLAQHSLSLTTLMLDDVSFGDTISSPVNFPSLTYLSLSDVSGLKPHIIAPCLATYHEGADTVHESFSTPLPSLVEYGLYGPDYGYSDPTTWHSSFPNISRVAIRAVPRVLVTLLDTLSTHRSLLALRTISVGSVNTPITKDEQEIMKRLVGARSDACQMDITLCFEKAAPFQIPIFFGVVSHRTIRRLMDSDARTGSRLLLVKAKATQCFHKTRFHSALFA